MELCMHDFCVNASTSTTLPWNLTLRCLRKFILIYTGHDTLSKFGMKEKIFFLLFWYSSLVYATYVNFASSLLRKREHNYAYFYIPIYSRVPVVSRIPILTRIVAPSPPPHLQLSCLFATLYMIMIRRSLYTVLNEYDSNGSIKLWRLNRSIDRSNWRPKTFNPTG